MAKTTAAFFVGSGISYLSKAPTVDGITKSLLTEKWTRTTTGSFARRRPETLIDPGDSDADRVQEFLKIIKFCIEGHIGLREQRECNYEDLFAATSQIIDDERGELPNPLIARKIEEIKAATAFLHASYSDLLGSRFITLAQHATDLIQSIVSILLREKIELKGLDRLSEAATAVDRLHIFSLNHDLLIEKQLRDSGIKYTDGFGERNGGVTQFSWSWRRSRASVNLLKLHGSINWHLCTIGDRSIACRIDTEFESCRLANRTLIRPTNCTPLFLTGTLVKERAYGYSLFGQLFAEFRESINKHQILICCGYGWGDKGINIRIDEWLRQSKDKKIVILHGGEDDLFANKSFWFNRRESLHRQRRLVVINKWLSDVSISQLRRYFD